MIWKVTNKKDRMIWEYEEATNYYIFKNKKQFVSPYKTLNYGS